MPAPIGQPTSSEFVQNSFIGGMNLLLDDTYLATNQYRVGFNVRNRFGRLDPINTSVEDKNIPKGVIQEFLVLGTYELIFVSGSAYYKSFSQKNWTKIDGFSMSASAPRYWTKLVPVSTTNYYRLAATINGSASVAGAINVLTIAGASAGNLPGLVVQDGINQPQFIYVNSSNQVIASTTQTFSQWSITFTDATNTVVAPQGDNREYVPIGTFMEYLNGILYIVSPDGNYIYRSVSGRPLDFVVNVTNNLVKSSPFIQKGGGDATTTAYSVGAGPITCIRTSSDGSLFVSANGANFSVSLDTSLNAQLVFGERPFVRKFLFNANCLSDRVIFDSAGDTRFIDNTGVRSFNAIESLQNEGRNSPFTAQIQQAFQQKIGPTQSKTIVQDSSATAGILFDNYELYAINTIFGDVIAVYDTINQCWTSFDVSQTAGKGIKIFSKYEIGILELFAVTEDNRLFNLYASPYLDIPLVRCIGINANFLYLGQNIKMASARNEIKASAVRVILNNVTATTECSVTPYPNNRRSKMGSIVKTYRYTEPPYPDNNPLSLPDVNTCLANLVFPTPNCEQGWKIFFNITWTNGSITLISCELADINAISPMRSQQQPNANNKPNS